MEEYEEYSQAVLASAGSGAVLAGSRRLAQVGKKKKTKCSFPDLMGIFADRWGVPAVPAVPEAHFVHAFTVAEPLVAAHLSTAPPRLPLPGDVVQVRQL
jgi:hypothetical protein